MGGILLFNKIVQTIITIMIKKMILVMNIKKMTFIGRFVDSLRLNEIVVMACEVEAVLVLVLLFVLLAVAIVAPTVDCGLVLVSVIISSVIIVADVEAVELILPVVSAVGLLA